MNTFPLFPFSVFVILNKIGLFENIERLNYHFIVGLELDDVDD